MLYPFHFPLRLIMRKRREKFRLTMSLTITAHWALHVSVQEDTLRTFTQNNFLFCYSNREMAAIDNMMVHFVSGNGIL